MKNSRIWKITKKILPNSIVAILRRFTQLIIKMKLLSKPYYRAYKPSIDVRFVNGRSRVSSSYRYIYFRIPKAANSSVIACLMKNEGLHEINRDNVELFKSRSHHLSDLEKIDIENDLCGYFKFTVVRNPYTRVYSAYLDKIARKKMESLHVYNRLCKPYDENISFSEFLLYLEKGGLSDDAHWAKQSDLISLPIRMLDKIGKVESLEEDLNEVMSRIYGSNAEVIEFRPHKTDADSAIAVLTDDQLERVYRLYKSDFDNFGYAHHSESKKTPWEKL